MTFKEVEKIGNRILIFAIVVISVLAFLCSCASRKVSKSETEIKTETEVKETTETKTDVNTNVVTVDTSTTNEIEFIPVDNTKPIIIEGKSYTNVIIKRVNKKNNVVTIENEKVSQIEQKAVKTKGKQVIEVEQKETQKETNYNWWWLIILLIISGYVIYRKYLLS